MSINLTQLAMYHYNFWPKAFLPPTAPGGVRMDNSSFVPNPLTSPALMVLASTAEGREAPRLPAPPHPFSSQSLDKDMSGPPHPPFSNAGFVYRPGEPFPTPLYAPIPPFVRPNLDRSLGLIGSSSGAFRHLGPHEGVEPYHSAFTPAKKTKIEDASCSSTTYSSDNHEQSGYDKDCDGSRKSHSPSVKEERPSSISSAGGDTNSEIHSDNGDPYDRGTPDSEGRSLRKSRKRTVDGHLPCCPICGLTLRPGEIEAHLNQELDKLERVCRGGRKSRDSTPSGRKTLPSPSGRKGKDSPSPEALSKSRFESYLRIRNNRQSRLNARSRNKRRRLGEETVCPICAERLNGTPEELNGHVELCLKKRHGEGEGEEEAVDVEGDGDQYEEYTWAGQTRIRATTMLEGGFAGSGFQTSSCKRTSEDEGDLNVDGDDSEQYGGPQFTENDLVPLSSDEPTEDKERQALRGSLLSQSDRVRMMDESETGEPTPGSSHSDMPLDLCQSVSMTNAGQGALVSALKARLKEVEGSKDAKQKCLICMNQYQDPLVSIQCWHVHCENCWFHTLGAKKLCPQCNMITSPSDLRRIYL